MKKEIKIVDEERGICRITTTDERWYDRETTNPETGLREFEFRPSVSWIGHFYPKGKGFENYLKKNGDDADILVQLAAERGSKVHQAIEALNKGESVPMDRQFISTITGLPEELNTNEYAAVMSYRDWWLAEGRNAYKILKVEYVVWPEGPGSEPGGPLHFAGTIDLKLQRIEDGTTGILDIKTSKDIYASHIIQVSAYAEAEKADWAAILQVGYSRNQRGYKFTEIERRFDLFLAAKAIWAYETDGEAPLQRDYPLALSLGLPKEEPEVEPLSPQPVEEPVPESLPGPEEAVDPEPEANETPRRAKKKKVATNSENES